MARALRELKVQTRLETKSPSLRGSKTRKGRGRFGIQIPMKEGLWRRVCFSCVLNESLFKG